MSNIEYDEQGWSSNGQHRIHHAACDGDVKQLKALIDKGDVSVDQVDLVDLVATKLGWTGWTPLMFSARHNQPATLRLLLDCKADINKTDKDGWTALMIAVWFTQRQCAQLLLEHKADRTVSASGYFQGMNALDMAREQRPDENEIITMLEALPPPEAPPAPFPSCAEKKKLPSSPPADDGIA